ncbi:unnamed protein product [Rotaria sp. Silwood1]|nr:unnamed protein product [Rotaria sp. Silwood1]CAF4663326.1 unnamed protein product [Rotaria sp. Silwood1]
MKYQENDGIRQYQTDDFYNYLSQTRHKRNARQELLCVAVTVADIYLNEIWDFVYGQAQAIDGVGVYSFARLDPLFSASLQTLLSFSLTDGHRVIILRRCVKILLHELGHLFGLKHCIYYICLMNGANNEIEMDRQPLYLCPVCLRKLYSTLQFNVRDVIAGMTLSPSVSENLYNQTLDTLRSSENKLCGICKQLNSESLRSSLTHDDLTQYHNFFRCEIESVEKLELRMAIVGTMKAGKSTILNAIMGYDLLPSRNTAMTTLPTEILFSQDTQQPQLILKSELINMINIIARQLQLKSNESNLQIRLRNEEDLIKMVHNMSANEPMTLTTTTNESSKIVGSLKYINDVVRISIMLNIENSIDSTWIPRLKVPLPHSFSIPQGEFIIIDTPGPNDNNLSSHLRQIVISELQKATLILVALEFIGSDSNDEAKLQEDIETIREYRNTDGPSHLYALVNKIDQRIEGKHNSVEQTKAAVAMKYKIPLTHVHEISAMNAILSYTFRQEYKELEKNSHVTYEILRRETKSYKMFMQQALGQTWEQATEYIDVNFLPNIADKLWKKSNYDSFLQNALGIVSQQVMPICLTMALQKCNYYIEKCYEKISIRKSCLDIGEKSLLETISRLEKDQQQLDSSRKETEKHLHQQILIVIERVNSLFNEASSGSEQYVVEIIDDKSTRHCRSHWKKLLHGKDILYFNTKVH